MNQKLKLLFLCTGNSCRSQMAEGWTRHLKSDQIEAYSAGIETHGLNPHMVTVMAEAGVDVTSQKSENIRDFADTQLDVVVTVCGHAHETCPYFQPIARWSMWVPRSSQDGEGTCREWSFEEEQLECYRKVRDEIRAFVETLPGSLDNH